MVPKSWQWCLGWVAWLGVLAGPAEAQQAWRAPPLISVAKAEQPIQLLRASIEGEVQAGVTQTRIELEFRNPNRRVMEGELQFPLADGQQVTGFALDIDGDLRAAVAVPKERGRQVFEQVIRQKVDPALLEQTAGNQFRLRVYPLPAGGTRRVQLTLRDAMPVRGEAWQWRLPLQFAVGAGQVRLHLQASSVPQGGTDGFRFNGRELTWQGSGRQLPAELQWQLPMQATARMQVAAYDGQQYLLAQVPVARPGARRLPGHVGLLWDASGSAVHRDRAREFALLDRYFAAMGEGEVQLTVLRDTAAPARRFVVRGGDWSALRKTLEQEPQDGASGLAGWRADPGVGEYLLFSDGLLNWGGDAQPSLSANQRLFAISSAGARTDSARLRGWAEGNRGRLLLLEGDDVAAVAAELLSMPVDVALADPVGLREVVLDRRSIGQGWLWILARSDDDTPALKLRVGEGDWQSVPLATDKADGALLAGLWAQARLQQLGTDPRRNREAMQRLSQAFSLVSEGTSLIVLDSLEDYLRFAIRPPAPMRAEYEQRFARQVADRDAARRSHLDAVAAQWKEREQWWNRRWPKDAPPKAAGPDARQRVAYAEAPAPAAAMAPPRPSMLPPPPPPPPSPPTDLAAEVADGASLDRVVVSAASANAAPAAEAAANDGALEIRLAAWVPDSEAAKRLRNGPSSTLYARYLAERAANADSSAFFLDVTDLLLAAGQKPLALRVLSNLAEMDLDNRHLLRVLGYRLMQAGEPALAVPVFEQVRVMAEDEPQSFRDLGLALEASGQAQAALQPLYEVVQREWDSRFDGVALIALDELTNLVARSRTPLDVQMIDPRLRKAMPLDLRVVLAWDSDNSDMDLWVTDPNGERAYYGNRLTRQGGQMSQDFTGGYGPEQFSLRDAKPGIYKVEANYFGSREQLVTGWATLMLRLSTHWGTPGQQDKAVTMRLSETESTVLVGEFEVR
ncbi:VIT domain-containing protein [Stenotrophomonas sp. MH1]|uniref:VIT domain-containing protein n=1 Tax=Stenotrophomonas capsici TaxID=3110230 RepID=A0ABU5V0C1_9GAMM|nr:VIT domain-containing protein [Stenotrophomonas sp. MH1]MEA5666784.1 VIT domain-containing protein [Stenotrophomonas sp. MH1]